MARYFDSICGTSEYINPKDAINDTELIEYYKTVSDKPLNNKEVIDELKELDEILKNLTLQTPQPINSGVKPKTYSINY